MLSEERLRAGRLNFEYFLTEKNFADAKD